MFDFGINFSSILRVSGLGLHTSTVLSRREKKEKTFSTYCFVCWKYVSKDGGKRKKPFTFPRTKEEFVLWGGNMIQFLTRPL